MPNDGSASGAATTHTAFVRACGRGCGVTVISTKEGVPIPHVPSMSHMRPWLAHYDSDVPKTLAPYPERTLLDLARTTGDRRLHRCIEWSRRERGTTWSSSACRIRSCAIESVVATRSRDDG